jgi:hypothetical protein
MPTFRTVGAFPETPLPIFTPMGGVSRNAPTDVHTFAPIRGVSRNAPTDFYLGLTQGPLEAVYK